MLDGVGQISLQRAASGPCCPEGITATCLPFSATLQALQALLLGLDAAWKLRSWIEAALCTPSALSPHLCLLCGLNTLGAVTVHANLQMIGF